MSAAFCAGKGSLRRDAGQGDARFGGEGLKGEMEATEHGNASSASVVR